MRILSLSDGPAGRIFVTSGKEKRFFSIDLNFPVWKDVEFVLGEVRPKGRKGPKENLPFERALKWSAYLYSAADNLSTLTLTFYTGTIRIKHLSSLQLFRHI